VDGVTIDGAGVYFIQSAGLTKIGMTCGLRRRQAAIQSGSPLMVILVKFFPERDDQRRYALEQRMHRIFHRFRSHGEWFALPVGWRRVAQMAYDGQLRGDEDDLDTILDTIGQEAPLWPITRS
jgi:hypothetical protein